jgi:hypothetical protein
MKNIIEGEAINTYGGNYIYRDVWFEIEDGKKVYYELVYGRGICNPKPEKINEKDI